MADTTLSSSMQRNRWLGASSNESTNETNRNGGFEASATIQDDVFPYTSLLLLWLLHSAYFLQWKRRRRKHLTVCLNDLVVRRRFDKIWIALFSMFRVKDDSADPPGNETSSLLAVPMGNSVENALPFSSSFQQRGRHILRFYVFIGGKAALRLFYFSHLIWSCRALETHFGSSVRYLRAISSCACWNIGLFSWILHKSTDSLLPPSSPERQRIQKGDLAISPLVFCVALVIAFQATFPHTAIPAMPLLYVPHSNLMVGYMAMMLPLVFLSSIPNMIQTNLFSFLWVQFGMPDLCLFALMAIVVMSHQWLGSSVGWDRNTGQMRIYDNETNEWTDYEPYLSTENTTGSGSLESDSDSDGYEDNSIAAGSSDDEIELGGPSAADDERAPLIANDGVWRNQMRSRRGAQNTD